MEKIVIRKGKVSIPEAIIHCARFLGNDKTNLLDHVNIETHLPLAIEEAIKFIQKNTRLSSEIKELRRKDIPEYPPVALREAIVNAVVHVDYFVKGVYISIAIFDHRIEITNSGGLPFRVTLYSKKISKIVFESWQKELINYLKKKGKISTKQAAHLWKVTERTARTHFIKLINAGIVKKISTSLKDPYGTYILNEHD